MPSPDGSGTVVDHGVHAIVVPLRDAAGKSLPGVEVKDCGYKVAICTVYSNDALAVVHCSAALTIKSHKLTA